ncbi:inner membrane-spanning protein YciB [Pseudooceanicola sp.]|uniref:inner membrane-spanning protein YciB n=1 Tax=Pseudooceanicola sp. TaxID=1914328 RepID=UPI00261A5C53|nr:inner membrane-spanning protein YciB [Pseudooceanicola sp.]MDF1854793.1 septation protein IspZ [Pseudooceanicola sp.]
MSNTKPAGWVKPALELGPILAFFVAYLLVRDRSFQIAGREYEGFILVTAGFVPLILLSTFLLWRLTGRLSKMQIATAVLITVFGGLSVWLNDDRFFKMKPTLIYLLFGGTLGFGLLRGESWLRHVMEEAVPLDHEGWMKLTRRLTLFFFALALLNEVIWRTQSTDTWVWFKTFGLTAAVFGFFLLQGRLFSAHAVEPDKDDCDADGEGPERPDNLPR